MSTVPKRRADAVRNRAAALAAADRLFGDASDPDEVTMADIARAAGIGKGTLFGHFSDRTGLVLALVSQRTAGLREEILAGPPPLGPGAPAAERVPALLAALLDFKLANGPLMLTLEREGSSSPYLNAAYGLWHGELTALLTEARGPEHAAYLAHALLASIRSDLILHATEHDAMSAERLHAGVQELCRSVLAR
ncbi:TetR/AcrR family transcriptional regulator [Spirillospora sp. CA-294931]|uniref:TetR/AcrR family transcriptional regulator n=1 Tax=Spirillospora sp. CA-294931 TaxID=3240042 RepID=UPI003D8A45FC